MQPGSVVLRSGRIADASAVGFISAVGNKAGFVGPTIFGNAADVSNMATSLRTISPWTLVGAVLLVSMDQFRHWRIRRSGT